MREAVLEGMSFCMVLLLGLCADGLAERPGGLVVLLVGMLLSCWISCRIYARKEF